MHATYSPEERLFQDQVRSFLRNNFNAELAARIREPETFKAATIEWQKKRFAKGWVAPGWPVEYGGCAWTDTQKYIFDGALAEAEAPDVPPFGLKMVGPVIYTFGNEEQKARFLPGILNGDTWWCQGYSEPGAGSDLVALQTRAERDGDDYIINGTKIWTTYAQHADWIFALVRTDTTAKPQQGISFLLIDMRSSGVSVAPITSIDGEHHLNEVRFDNVRVPVANRIGEENKGWTYAKALLTHERTALSGIAYCKQVLNTVRRLAADENDDGQALLASPTLQARMADIEMELMALEYTELRVLAAVAKGGAPGMESSLLKLKGTELQQAVQSLQFDVAGLYGSVLPSTGLAMGHDYGDRARREYMFGRACTIYGGSNEVQKNIIAKFGLGL
ncbi:MAG: acyl-CoA dehydrogenase family protein [Zhongshania sp.]|uniref:acyl-CoA dehydrogenase family protein n=1 Tax=Zhongshania sp. TaxID=1971902 RepID=UPI0026242FD7|nr:acyl-CoA dehydrogenase family protein [Zhongshania sp.]MDF1692740.1 acyl-CoA dehydrogenase family protein [Zhongshania sp.]